jgi:outer membrane protein assembly factor BamA
MVRKKSPFYLVAVILALLIGVSVQPVTAAAQTQSITRDTGDQEGSTQTKSAEPQKEQKQKKEKRGEIVAAPIPISSPAIGSGLQWAVGYMFPFSKDDKVAPKSVLGVGGLFTNNGSKGLALGGRIYFREDKYRLTIAGGGAKINADIYGIGNAAGNSDLFLPLTFKASAFIGEPLFRIHESVYVGARFQTRSINLLLNREDSDIPPSGTLPPELEAIRNQIADFFKQRTTSLGPRFQWDTRDNTYYPVKGFFLDSGIDLFGENIGSRWTYQYTKIVFNKYTTVAKNQVLAIRGMGCAAMGDHVPIYDLCLFGTSSDIRGYTAGRYQDRRMFATQAEYRLTLPSKGFMGRFGVVGFGGFGGVARSFGDMAWSDLLPGGGGGLRFRLTKSEKVNFRMDFGFGKNGHTFSMGLGEAF